MDSLYIVMPAYNEEANIKDVICAWYKIIDDKSDLSRIVIADSGSEDQTHKILLQLKRDYPRLEILETTDKQHGQKVIALYDYAIKKKADYIFQTDSDGQTSPEEFQSFWDLRHEYDGVFGHRIHRGDGKGRAFVENVVCFLLRAIYGVRVPDANAPFRLMRSEVLKKYLYRISSDFNLPNIIITMFYVYYKEKYCFIPISFKPRQGGINSINLKRIIGIGWKAIGDFVRIKQKMR